MLYFIMPKNMLTAFKDHKTRMLDPTKSDYLLEAQKMPEARERLNTFPLPKVPAKIFDQDTFLANAQQNSPAVQFPPLSLIQDLNFCKKSLREANFADSALLNCNFYGTSFAEANIQNAALMLVDMHSTLAENLNAKGTSSAFVDFSRAQLKNASFANGDMYFVSFLGADLSGANFTNTTFGKGVLMIGANMDRGASLPGAILLASDLTPLIEAKTYSFDELVFLHHVLSQSETDLKATLSSKRGIGAAYLTPSHLDEVTSAKDIVKSALAAYLPSP